MSERRESSCDCIALTNEALARQFGAHLPLMLNLDGSRPHSVVITTWLNQKTRGQRAPSLVAEFCPFCGVRYGWKDEQVEAAS